MDSNEAIDIIARERRFIERWLHQDTLPETDDRILIKDREVTQCLLVLTQTARYAPPHEAALVAKIVELAEARLNTAR